MDLRARKIRYTELRATGYTLPTRIEEHVLAVYHHRVKKTAVSSLLCGVTEQRAQRERACMQTARLGYYKIKCKVTDHRV